MSNRKSSLSGLLVSLAAVLMALTPTGCQNQSRFSIHGAEIIQYQGDRDLLMNCCSAAMALLAEDIGQDKGLDSYPPMYEKITGWTSKKKGSTDATNKTTGWRMTLTCQDANRQHRIEIAWVEDRPATIIICRPDDDDALVNHLRKLFSNFDVKLVSAI